MPVNNGFAIARRAPANHYRTGFMVQLGRYYNYENRQPDFVPGWLRVEIHDQNGVIETYHRDLSRGDPFDWISIETERTGAPAGPPINRNQAGHLFPDPNDAKNFGDVDGCAERVNPRRPTPRKCLCKTEPCPQKEHIPRPCARTRTIHAHFSAETVITFWGGDTGYDVNVEQNNHRHDDFTFSSMEDVTVNVYHQNRRIDTFPKGQVKLIKIVGKHTDSGDYHGSVHEPPLGLGP